MVEPVKSVLLVDLDGLSRGLVAAGGAEMGERLTERIDDWSGAIESGELIGPAGAPRTFATRRCYGVPASTGEAREAFVRAGFEMIECAGQAQVELCLAIDAMGEAAAAEDGLDFILLTAAPDLTPLVERLHARGHHVAVLVSEATAADYQAAADLTISAGELVALLADAKAPAPVTTSAERSKIEAFAREIHTATNIPMFSPKTFADLFRFLTSEVTEHGYHFSDTAKAVAERLTDAGRNVTSRQVVFVVKGLALKGHVFSTSDTAEHLAEVFREQARYLINGAGIALDADREALLTAWIAAPAALPAKAAPVSRPTADDRPARKPVPQRRPEKPAAAKPATPPRLPERPKSAIVPAKAAPSAPEPPKPTKSSADIRATIAARIAASAKMKPANRPPAKTDSPAHAPRKPATAAEADEAIESSILAAIAEAVDVLVEDGGSDRAEERSAPPEREAHEPAPRRAAADRPPEAERPPAAKPPPPEEEREDEGGDIGDEIQRIVASYNRNREDEGRG